jgi:hypothetical protein
VRQVQRSNDNGYSLRYVDVEEERKKEGKKERSLRRIIPTRCSLERRQGLNERRELARWSTSRDATQDVEREVEKAEGSAIGFRWINVKSPHCRYAVLGDESVARGWT